MSHGRLALNAARRTRSQGPTTAHDAGVAIYLAKLGPASSKATRRLGEFDITSMAVRDVWTGKTWLAKTMPVHAQQHYNNFLLSGAVSPPAVTARVARALCPSPVR